MKLFTTVKTPDAPWKLSPGASIVSIGSCFASAIAERLSTNKFDTLLNPFGTLYNPLSICELLIHAISNDSYSEKNLFSFENRRIPLNHATKFEMDSVEVSLEKMNDVDSTVREYLNKSELLILTFGTSWVYELTELEKIVGNCHKLPAKMFRRKQLSPNKITSKLEQLLSVLKENYPNLKILFTISPVRHVRDSMVQNSRSKALLLYTIGELCERFPDTTYFPSYEIMMDELRDYRFYSDDLVQPSPLAKDIIWERFSYMALSDSARQFIALYEKINTAMSHRFSENSDTQKFTKKMLQKIFHLEQGFPTIDFQVEKEYFYSL